MDAVNPCQLKATLFDYRPHRAGGRYARKAAQTKVVSAAVVTRRNGNLRQAARTESKTGEKNETSMRSSEFKFRTRELIRSSLGYFTLIK